MTDRPDAFVEASRSTSPGEATQVALSGTAPREGASHWGVLDQAVSSVTNLVPTVLVARAVGVRDFSAFAAVMTGAIVLIGLLRATVTEPLLVRSPSTRHDRQAVARDAVGLALVAGLAAVGLTLVLRFAAVDGPVAGPLLALAVVLPGVFLQDTSRYLLFAAMRHRAAFVNDTLWLAVLVAAFAGARVAGHDVTSARAVLLWGAAGTAAGLVSLVQVGIVRPAAPWALLRANADVARHLSLQFVALTGAGHLSLFLLGAVTNLDALGSVRAIQLLFGPLNVVFMGVYVTLLPRGIGARTEDFTRSLVRASAALAGMVIACSVAVLVAPDSLGRAVLGDTWTSAQALVIPYGCYLLMVSCATGPTVGLTMLARFGVLTSLRLGSLPFVVVIPVAAGAGWGAGGYVTAQAGVAAVLAVVWWATLHRSLARAPLGRLTEAELG